MSKNDILQLSPKEELEIIECAKSIKGSAQLSLEAPIANDIFMLLEKNNIILVKLPIERVGSNSFSAMFLSTEENGVQYAFLGLNTKEYYDKQLFAIAHELYHFKNKSKSHISRDGESTDPYEVKADLFAAEFLLPAEVLRKKVIIEFNKTNIVAKQSAILRFIARIHCTWWIPYKSIVKRLKEINAISDEIYSELFNIDERSSGSEYYKIGVATNREIFEMLNNMTEETGADASSLEVVVRNFEIGIIDENEFIEGIKIFGKIPSDFGVLIESCEEDDDMNAFFNRGTADEG